MPRTVVLGEKPGKRYVSWSLRCKRIRRSCHVSSISKNHKTRGQQGFHKKNSSFLPTIFGEEAKNEYTVIFSGVLVLALTSLSMAADDPFVGTWKLNVEKSSISAGEIRYETRCTIEARENGQAVKDAVTNDGQAIPDVLVVTFDGKDYPPPSRGKQQRVITYTATRIDANTIEVVNKIGGVKVVGSFRDVISEDGSTLTRTVKALTSRGANPTSILLYEKE
jgi:hypothetical protein